MAKDFEKDKFSYWKYLNKRLSRVWPGLVLISALSLLIGYYCMLPLHFKSNCESVIATGLFGNNFVQWITCGDYWNSTNEFKPLMHTWYIGILMQFYIVFPLIFIVIKRFTILWVRNTVYTLIVLSLYSLLIYVSPIMDESQNFYLLPSRFFELGAGGILAIITKRPEVNLTGIRHFCFFAILVFALLLMFCPAIDVMKLRLIIVVAISVVLVWCSNYFSITGTLYKILLPISFMGVASYSLYLSHQVCFAFYRYIVNNVFSTSTYIWVLCATIAVGIILYFIFEKPISAYLQKKNRRMYILNCVCLISFIVLLIPSFYWYKQNGLVRDIPELDLYVGEDSLMPESYNNAPHSFNKDFEDNGKKNILVIGDSFGRDWINVLCQAGVDKVMNISYTVLVDENTKGRLLKADYVFVATFRPFFSSFNYDSIYPQLFNRKFYRVGLKSFGDVFMGNIYNNRHSEDYFDATVEEGKSSKDINAYEKAIFRDNFIDMITPISGEDGKIKLFTDDKKLITIDCVHLTKAGAKLYAEKLNVWQYLK